MKYHAVIDEAVAEPFGDDLLQRLELRIDEFDDLAGLDVDQMVVMRLGRRFVARAAVAEIVAVEDARFLEQADGAIDGSDRNAAVERRGALVKRLHVGMILGIRNHARDDASLRSEEGRVGTEGGITCRYRWLPYP